LLAGRVQIRLGDVDFHVVRGKDHTLPVRGDIQVRIIALTGGNLFRGATSCRDFPDIQRAAATRCEIDEAAICRPGLREHQRAVLGQPADFTGI
jgi:hypothetical protein